MISLPQAPLSRAVSVEDCNKRLDGASLSGKNVLITGGASGVGAAIAQTYAEKGAYVTLVDINEDLGAQHADFLVSRGHHAQFVRTDITSWDDQLRAFKAATRFHPTHTLDIVIACAAVLGSPFVTPTETPFDPSSSSSDPPPPDVSPININTIGLTYTAKLAQLFFELPTTAPAPTTPKSLVLFTSMLAYVDSPNNAAYAASKYAVRGLFRDLRPLFAWRGHRVNSVAPWLTRTPMTDGTKGGGAPDVVGLFERVGCPVAMSTEWAVRACMLVEEGEGLNGRVLAAGPDRVFDMRDDTEGNDGAKGLEYFHREVIPGWHDHVEKMRLIVEGEKESD